MALERTLIILKPDAVGRGLMGRIIARFEDKGLRVAGMKMQKISRAVAQKHYGEHKDKPFFSGLLQFITAGPVLLMALEGRNAVAVSRKLMGATFGSNAEPGTIRGDFGVSNTNNLIHGSDSVASAKRELALYFNKGELINTANEDLRWVYDFSGKTPI